MAEARIEMGVSREIAENGPGAHAITKWLGNDAPDINPRTGQLAVSQGWVVVCSDGLWNYASTPAEIRAVLETGLAGSPANLVDLCEHMVAWANEQGGKDNISVTLARLGDLPVPAPVAAATQTDPASVVTPVAPSEDGPEAAPLVLAEPDISGQDAPTEA
jgi:serine/threonine protein phosphatase PrpC